ARLGVAEDRVTIAELILLIREDVESDTSIRQGLAIGEQGRKLQPSGVKDEIFLDRAAALDFDLLGEVGETIGGVDEILAGEQRRGRHGLAVGADELVAAVG